MRFLICFLLVFATAAHAHSQAEHKLVSDDGYVWFHQDYDYRVNTVTVTNSKHDTRVANIKGALRGKRDIKNIEGEPIKVIWNKGKLQSYLALSLKRSDLVRVFNALGDKENFNVVFDDLYIESLDVKYLCDDCNKKFSFSNLKNDYLSLLDIPKHYYINNQVFLIHSSIYPGSIEIDSLIKAKTILSISDVDKKISLYPASLKSQPIFFKSRPAKPSGGGTGGGNPKIRVRKKPSHPDRQGP